MTTTAIIDEPAAPTASLPPGFSWHVFPERIDWDAMETLYRRAPLGNKSAEHLREVFTNSRYRCFLFHGQTLIGAGRALADGRDCAYLADIALLPEYQGLGLGKWLVRTMLALTEGHAKRILYAAAGKSEFYLPLGFRRMGTAMALFRDEGPALASGVLLAE